MKTIRLCASAVMLLLGAGLANAAATCSKECRLSYQACAKNHSQAACKTELDICIKHCPKK